MDSEVLKEDASRWEDSMARWDGVLEEERDCLAMVHYRWSAPERGDQA